MMYGYGYGPDFAFMHVFSWLIPVLVVILVIGLLRRSRGWRRGGPGWWDSDQAMSILKERYAKGEINKEEFETKKKDLMS